MKHLISLTLAVLICLSSLTAVAFAADTAADIVSVELTKAEYYAAVATEEEIADAVLHIIFDVNFTNGTSATYDSDSGWSDPEITKTVSWFVKNEVDEDFGAQQSLYAVIDGQEYWLGYVDVKVDKVEAVARFIIVWDKRNTPVKLGFLSLILAFLEKLFSVLNNEVGPNDSFVDIGDAMGKIRGLIEEILGNDNFFGNAA